MRFPGAGPEAKATSKAAQTLQPSVLPTQQEPQIVQLTSEEAPPLPPPRTTTEMLEWAVGSHPAGSRVPPIGDRIDAAKDDPLSTWLGEIMSSS
jgi:hypothetical protein